MHSILSHDGSISFAQYSKLLATNVLDIVAITDHNQQAFAHQLYTKFPSQVIVGEEISSRDGDIIGLFLTKLIAPHQDMITTCQAIFEQGGLVYIPHPFDTLRHGLGRSNLNNLLTWINDISKPTPDPNQNPKTKIIFETFNSRCLLPNFNNQAKEFAQDHQLSQACGSDAHALSELGTTYNLLDFNQLTPHDLCHGFKTAQHITQRLKPLQALTPKLNELKKLVGTLDTYDHT